MTDVANRSEPDLPTCRCGHSRKHHAVDAKRTFGFWSWILLFAGGSATPRRIVFRCRQCGQIVETTTDSEVMRAYRQ